jgi:hypothetical protein
VTWQVLGGAANGSVDASGLYSAPAAMPASASVTVRCVSVADPLAHDDALVTLVAPPPPASPGLPVTLRVGTAGGWTSVAAPVTSGVPLAKGTISDATQLRVHDGAGTVVPAQFRVLSRWSDGSIRWVLADFIGATPAVYTLERAASAPPPAGIVVTQTAGAIDVDTGPLLFRVSKSAFRLFESVRIDRDGDGQADDECLDAAALAGVVVADGGTDYRMDRIAPDSIALEESGPVRICIRAEGRHRATAGGADRLRWIVRIHAWKGLPWVKVVYSFRNLQHSGEANGDNAAQAAQLAGHVDADSVRLDLPLALPGAPSVLFGGDPSSHAGALSAGQSASLFQTYTGAHDATDSNNPQPAGYDGGTGDGSSDPLTNVWPTEGPEKISYAVAGAIAGSGGHAPGYLQMAAAAGADQIRVTATLRDFWQLYPKSLEASADGRLRIGIWPDAAWRLQVFEGAMKTHEMLFSFERTGSTAAAAGDLLRAFADDAPFAACDPVHYKTARVFGDIGTTNAAATDASAFQAAHQARAGAYLAQFPRHMGDLIGDRADGNGHAVGHEYGMWNWGDGKTTDEEGAWENQHWSISRACFVWFAASGNRDFLAFGDTALRHFRDVDVLHSDVGRRYSYAEPGNPAVGPYGTSQIGKTRYNPNNKQHDLGNYHLGSMNFESFKGEMLGDHYLLYGDGLSLEVLGEAFTYLRGTWKRFFDSANGGDDQTLACAPRWISNALFVAMSWHECTGSAEAKAMADYVLARAKARQRTVKPRDAAGKGFSDSSGYVQSWMVGHMLEAFEWWRWIMEDPSIDVHIRDGMEWLLSGEAGVYVGSGSFVDSPGSGVNFASINFMIGAGYTGALRASGDNLWRTRAAELVDAQIGDLQGPLLGVNHKSTAQRFRAGPAMLRAFQD